jgi:hypothetical protein
MGGWLPTSKTIFRHFQVPTGMPNMCFLAKNDFFDISRSFFAYQTKALLEKMN